MLEYAAASYRAGAEEMRERAAKYVESHYLAGTVVADAESIRALPLDDQP
jgi:hypothetical protein